MKLTFCATNSNIIDGAKYIEIEMQELVGREKEQDVLKYLYNSEQPAFLAEEELEGLF